MNSNLLSPSSLPTLLQPGALLSLTSAAGLCVEVISGRLWLTEEHDPDDHFIGAGQRHVVQRHGRLVLEVDGRVPVRLVFSGADQPADRRTTSVAGTLAVNG